MDGSWDAALWPLEDFASWGEGDWDDAKFWEASGIGWETELSGLEEGETGEYPMTWIWNESTQSYLGLTEISVKVREDGWEGQYRDQDNKVWDVIFSEQGKRQPTSERKVFYLPVTKEGAEQFVTQAWPHGPEAVPVPREEEPWEDLVRKARAEAMQVSSSTPQLPDAPAPLQEEEPWQALVDRVGPKHALSVQMEREAMQVLSSSVAPVVEPASSAKKPTTVRQGSAALTECPSWNCLPDDESFNAKEAVLREFKEVFQKKPCGNDRANTLDSKVLHGMTLAEHVVHVKWYDSPQMFKQKMPDDISPALWSEMAEIFCLWHAYGMDDPQQVLFCLKQKYALEYFCCTSSVVDPIAYWSFLGAFFHSISVGLGKALDHASPPWNPHRMNDPRPPVYFPRLVG